MSYLYIIRGLPGSGKSTYVNKTLNNFDDLLLIEADMFFEDVNGNYNFDPSLIKQAHEWCYKTCQELLKQGKKVAVANTFTRLWEFTKYINLAKTLEINYEVIKMETQYASIHNIPKETIKMMKDRFEDYKNEIKINK